MNFLELLQALEHRLGYQHLPVNPRASTLKRIFECSPVHHELMYRIVHALYYTNGCEKLTDVVGRDACFEAVGPVRQNALRTPTADVDAYRLLDELCHALDEIFAVERAPPPNAVAEEKPPAAVIRFDAARRCRSKPSH